MRDNYSSGTVRLAFGLLVVFGYAVHGTAYGADFDVVLSNGQHVDGRPIALCDHRTELSQSDYRLDSSPYLSACRAAAHLFWEGRMPDAAQKYWLVGCDAGDISSCTEAADGLMELGKRQDALELLARTCANKSYQGLLAALDAKSCDMEMLKVVDDAEIKSRLLNRLCVMGHDADSCAELVRQAKKPAAMVGHAQTLNDQDASEVQDLRRLETDLRERDYQDYLREGHSPNAYEGACLAPTPVATTWSPTTSSHFLPDVWIGCSATIENACSTHQLVQLSIINRGIEARAVRFNWDIDANVPTRSAEVKVDDLEPGSMVLRFERVDYRGSAGPIRARAAGCIFESVAVGEPNGMGTSALGDQQGRVALPVSPTERDVLTDQSTSFVEGAATEMKAPQPH